MYVDLQFISKIAYVLLCIYKLIYTITSTTSGITRPYAHWDLVPKIFCQIVSVHNFLLSMVLLVTLPAMTI